MNILFYHQFAIIVSYYLFTCCLTDCPIETINSIKSFWNENPPRNILQSYVGTVTYVWMTRSFIQDKLNRGLLCSATNLNSDMTTATDIMVYKNRTPIADEITYNMKQNEDGVLTLFSHGDPDDTQYVISYRDHVSTFWQCKVSNVDQYEPFVGISVDISYLHTREARQAVEEGKELLYKLNLNTGAAPLHPCTEDHIQTQTESVSSSIMEQ